MVSAIAALLILSATPENPQGEHMDIIILICWTIFLAAFGTVLAIPMKRNLINQEKLKFPSGTAAATTLQSLYSEGVEALKKAKALTIAAASGAIFPLLIELKVKAGGALMAAEWHIFDKLPAPGGTHLIDGKEVPYKSSDWTMVWDVNPVMIAAGALVGLRIAIYMMIGGLALVYGLGDMGMNAEWVNADGEVVQAVSKPWKAWKEIGLWTGVPIMLSYGLLQFATQWRTIVRAFSGLGKKTEVAGHQAQLVAATEVPTSWFATGFCLSGAAIIAVHRQRLFQ